MALFIVSILLLEAITTCAHTYIYIQYDDGIDRGRLCLKNITYLTTTLVDCCSANSVTFQSGKLKIGSSNCFLQESDSLKISPDLFSCSLFDHVNGQMVLRGVGTPLCLRLNTTDNQRSIKVKACSSIGKETWHLDGVCPDVKTGLTGAYTNTVDGIHLRNDGGELKLIQNQNVEQVKYFSNNEIWSVDDSKCVTMSPSSWPTFLADLAGQQLGFRGACKGAQFTYRHDVKSYELIHTGYCMKKKSSSTKDVILVRCSTLPNYVHPTTTTVTQKTSTLATSATSSAPHTYATSAKSTALHTYATSVTSTVPHTYATSATSTATHTYATSATSTVPHTYATSATPSAPHTYATSATPSALHTYATSATPSAPHTYATSATPSAPHTYATSATPSAPHTYATSATSTAPHTYATSVTPTYSISPSTSPTAQPMAKCNQACHGLQLASAGQQCEDFCKNQGLFCSSTIETGNSPTSFLSSGVTCNDTVSRMKWQKPYDPAFYPADASCAGYVDVNTTVACVVQGFNDSNIRRLCRCLKSAEEDDFNHWLPWSPCTTLCGGGTQSRSRTCKTDTCTGLYLEEKECNTNSCPIDGGFSSWTAWTGCSVPCGGGKRYKQRECNNPHPKHGGLKCYGDRNISEICGSNFCPINGGWTPWTDWSACDKPCNTGMYRRWRYCTNPAPLYGGSGCADNSTESLPCNTKPCPAENIAVVNIRFDKEWLAGMETRGSQNFTDFYHLLEKNVRSIFEFSTFNSTYKYSAIENLRRGSVKATFTLYFSALDSFQVLLLQEAIDVDKYLGKLKLLGSNSTYNTTIVPSSPPLNFTLNSSRTSIKAEWKEVPKNLQNGNVSGYILFYREKMLMSEPYKSLATVHLNATVLGLTVFTEYVFRVLSYNENGNGLASEEQSIYTQETTPSQPPTNLTVNATSGFSAIITWVNIPQAYWNGLPVGSIVKFSDLKGHSGSVTAAFPKGFAVVNGLIPSTTYVFDVCHTTSVGEGPCQRIQCTTLPSAPSKPPSNVSIESFVGHNTLDVSWESISAEYIHGDLKGYKIIYTLIKTAGASVVASLKTLNIHPSLKRKTLTQLQPNSQYSVEILAYNEIGDGVKSAAYIGETCACPQKIYTNYAASAPYIYKDKLGNMRGLLADMLNNLTSYACGGCKNRTSTLDYVTNGKNSWAEKRSITEMKNDIDDYVHLSFPVFGSTVLESYNGYAFVSVFPHPGVVYYIIKDTLTKTVQKMLVSVLKTWPIFLINVLFITLSGFCIWALDSKTNPDEFPRSCLPGVFNGMYWSFITMGTHGYGDLTPRSIVARLFAVVWILIGLINFAIFTGALTTAITTANVYSDPLIYGVEVAAVHDTVAYKAGIFRNAKVNTKAQYKSIEEVAAALKRRDVRGALVDVYSAATRSDLFKHPDIVAKKRLNYPSAFGFVLSGDMKNAASKFRDYVAINANDILKTMKSKTSGLEVNVERGVTIAVFAPESPFLKKTLLITGVLLIISAVIGVSFYYGNKYRNRHEIVPEQAQMLEEMERLCDEQLTMFAESVAMKLGKQVERQLEERRKFLRNGKVKRFRTEEAKPQMDESLPAERDVISQATWLTDCDTPRKSKDIITHCSSITSDELKLL